MKLSSNINFDSITQKQYSYLCYLMDILNVSPILLCQESSEKYKREITYISQLSKREASEIISNCVETATELGLLKPAYKSESKNENDDDIPF